MSLVHWVGDRHSPHVWVLHAVIFICWVCIYTHVPKNTCCSNSIMSRCDVTILLTSSVYLNYHILSSNWYYINRNWWQKIRAIFSTHNNIWDYHLSIGVRSLTVPVNFNDWYFWTDIKYEVVPIILVLLNTIHWLNICRSCKNLSCHGHRTRAFCAAANINYN